jgi:hypothetical protein
MHAKQFALLGLIVAINACSLNAATPANDQNEEASSPKKADSTDQSAGSGATATAIAKRSGTGTADVGAAPSGTAPSGTASAGRELYFGKWTYQPGSAFVLSCPGQPAQITDLSAAGENGEPGSFDLSENGDRIREVDGLGCELSFALEYGMIMTPEAETCSKFPDGRGGFTNITTDVTHKATADGRTMQVAAHGRVGADGACDLWVEGTAKKDGDLSAAAAPANMPPPMSFGGGSLTYAKSSARIVACSGQPASVTDLSGTPVAKEDLAGPSPIIAGRTTNDDGCDVFTAGVVEQAPAR